MQCVTRSCSVAKFESEYFISSLLIFSLVFTGDLSKLKDQPITIKEGVAYRIKITFKVNSLGSFSCA